MKKGFTFIEILVVIAIIAVLSAIVALILNPAEYLRRARDSQRLSDATRINQALALYNFSTSFNNVTQDMDGPHFPDPPPPTTESCKGESNPRIFISVPIDLEQAPSRTDGWSYAQVDSSQLRAIDGDGWLPVDFTQNNSASAPFSVLPVDPVNTFASGYYYSYGCGSWNINMRFESTKYQDLAQTDGGQFPGVYEVGSDLNVLPEQDAYNQGSTLGGEVTTETATLYPISNGVLVQWDISSGNPLYSDSANPGILNDISDTTNIYTSVQGNISYYKMTNLNIPVNAIITKVEWIAKARDYNNNAIFQIKPYLYVNSANYGSVGDPISLGPTNDSTDFIEYPVTFFTNPFTDEAWTQSEINNLGAGVILSLKTSTGAARVSEFRVEVTYTLNN